MNHPLIMIGAFLIGWGLYSPKKEPLTPEPESDNVDSTKAKPVPIDEKADSDNSNSELDSGDGI